MGPKCISLCTLFDFEKLVWGFGFGGLFRDSSGDPLLAFAESIDNPSILNIELAAISRALKIGLASI